MLESRVSAVEEVQGLYGPFQFPELLLQRIWAERSFRSRGAQTVAGEGIKIVRAGRWNRQEGPDFRDAEVQIAGRMLHGDIEMHLREPDWRAHGHAEDRNYDKVILHVVLFPAKRTTTAGEGGRQIPILVLLPLLWHDLEEYASDAAVSAIADRPADRLAQTWLQLTAEEAREKIIGEAEQRWRSKVHYAQIRLDKLGWTSAYHHAALEVLGYRFNRSPMLTAASRWPLEAWADADELPDEVFLELKDTWKLGAVRPPNHPLRRLRAYARWVEAVPAWPKVLEQCGRDWPVASGPLRPNHEVAALRREMGLKAQWQTVMQRVGVSGNVAQPRADNLWGDGLLPLLAAAGGVSPAVGFQWWYISWPGDQATNVMAAARLAGIADGKRNPLAWGHVQGLIGQQLRPVETGEEGDLTSDFTRG
jgi:hypothetical protein